VLGVIKKMKELINFIPSVIDYKHNNSVSDISDTYDKENVISISECLRLHLGNVKVRGTIVSISKLYKMIKGVLFVCNKCYSEEYMPNQIPKDHLDSYKRCSNCKEYMKVDRCNYVNAVKVEIQDSDKFSDIEKLSCILFDEYTLDIQIGSKVVVAGSVQIIQQKSGKSIPRLYSSFIQYENKQKFELSGQDISAIHRFKKIKKGLLVESLTKMVAPSVIDLDIVKKGLLLSVVSTSEDINVDGNRERLHVLLISNPGIGKSKLIKECVELVPNSRYESSQHASGKSLTAIVSKEDEDYCLRTGPIPLARGAMCVLNEIGRTSPEDQGFLLDVMEEGEFTINKYGINSKITSPTVIIASANPINSSNDINDKIDINQIPLIKPVIDRFDLVFVLRDSQDEDELREYAEHKIEKLSKKNPNYYSYLKKHIAFAKQFKPELSVEAWSLIKEYYVKLCTKHNILSSSMKFKSRRTFDTLIRIAKSVSKLKLKNVVDAEDAREALEFFNAVIYQYTKSTVFIPEDPKYVTISVFTEILKASPTAYSLEELTKKACEKNEFVKLYLWGNKNNYNYSLKIENNRKLRSVYELLIENTHIARVKEKPIVLQWMNSHSLSDTTDIYDIPKDKNVCNENNDGNNGMSYVSDMSDTSTKNYSGKVEDKHSRGLNAFNAVTESKKDTNCDSVSKEKDPIIIENSKGLPNTVTTVTTFTSVNNENLSPVLGKLSPEEATVSSTKSLCTGDTGHIFTKIENKHENIDMEETQPSSKIGLLIGYRDPFHYCKQHLHVQNINKEEIKHHILYSKDHRQQSP
jgi:replicative DNA helicase Mcm